MQIYHVVDFDVVAAVAAIVVDVADVVDQQCWKSKSLVFDQVQQFPKAKQFNLFLLQENRKQASLTLN